jgi:hypothetical protein
MRALGVPLTTVPVFSSKKIFAVNTTLVLAPFESAKGEDNEVARTEEVEEEEDEEDVEDSAKGDIAKEDKAEEEADALLMRKGEPFVCGSR